MKEMMAFFFGCAGIAFITVFGFILLGASARKIVLRLMRQ